MSKKPSELTVLTRNFGDFDELSENLQGWNLDLTRMDRGPFVGEILQVGGEDFQFSSFNISCRHEQGGSPPPGLKTFGILSPTSPPIVFRNRQLGQEGICAFSPDKEVDVQAPPGWAAFGLSFTEDLLVSVSQRMGLPPWEDMLAQKDLAVCHPEVLFRLKSWLQSVRQQFSPASGNPFSKCFMDQFVSELPRRFLNTMASSSPITFRQSLRKRDRAIKKIKEFLAEFPDGPPTMEDLCEVAQVSERTLEYAFQARYGVTPHTYLRFYRLNGAQKVLRAADPASTTVTKVATDWGFRHFGRFSSHYREIFGERPFETLKNPKSGLPVK
jgi:AraC family ethanolamine operon transcriptional activator